MLRNELIDLRGFIDDDLHELDEILASTETEWEESIEDVELNGENTWTVVSILERIKSHISDFTI